MTELSLRGAHDDGERLVLADAAGVEYTLVVDDALRSALRRMQADASGASTGEAVRPRDIQKMIRSGMTADDVAAATGADLEHIRRYEHPVLAERSHIAEQAGRVLIYPDADGSSPTPLAELTRRRLRMREVDLDTLEWDAWKRADGSWYVEARFTAGSRTRTAGWTYSRGSVSPQDDEARWLSDSGPTDSGPIPNFGSADERHSGPPVPDAVAQPAARRPDPLTAQAARPSRDHQTETGRILESLRRRRGTAGEVPSARREAQETPGAPAPPVADDTAPGRLRLVDEGDAARIDGAHTAPSAPSEATDAGVVAVGAADEQPADPHSTAPILERGELPGHDGDDSAYTGPRIVPQVTAPAAPTAPAQPEAESRRSALDHPSLLDEPGVMDRDEPASASDPAADAAETADAQPEAPSSPQAETASERAAEPVSAPAAADDAASGETSGEQPEEPAKKRGRASVPSWDEIMFGSKRD